MTKLSIAIAKTSLLAAVMGASTFAVPAAAQLAAPQWTRPAMDSTHVTGTAERVMPEIASTPGTVGKIEPSSSAPKTVGELLVAFDGVLLEMPPSQRSGAFEQLRFKFSKEKMQVQFTAAWNWYDSCAVDATNTRCSHGVFDMMLSPEGFFIVRRKCGTSYGAAGGSAEFRYSDFQSFGGAAATPKHWTVLRDTFWANCYSDVGSND